LTLTLRLVATVISGFILIGAPLYIMRDIPPDVCLRFRLMSAFFVSLATTATALTHSVLAVISPGPWEMIVSVLNPLQHMHHNLHFVVRSRGAGACTDSMQRVSYHPVFRANVQHEGNLPR
jgi:hypothetical protein